MKTTVNINLNSFVFVIDEDAYVALNEYLSKLRSHFNDDEGSEIIKDIEARIAELFSQKLSNSKQVIGLDDVNEVIDILGNVNDITGESDEETEEEEESKAKDPNPDTGKKLYRNPEDRYIAGVCGGLASYTGMSSMIWRIIFLIFLFVPGQISLISYIILWIVMPEAKTRAQKIDMKGGKINLENIERTVKEELNQVKDNLNNNINRNKIAEFFDAIGSAFQAIFMAFGGLIGKLLGLVLVLVGAAGIIAIASYAFGSGFNTFFGVPESTNFFWTPNLFEFITSDENAYFLSIALFITLFIPVLALLIGGFRFLFNLKFPKQVGIILLATWLLGIIMTAVSMTNIGTHFWYQDDKVEKAYIPQNSSQVFEIEIDPQHKDFYFEDNDQMDDISDLDHFIHDHILPNDEIIQLFPEIRIYKTDDSLARYQVKYESRGSGYDDAAENLDIINYDYLIDTNRITLSPYFQIDSRVYRGQQVKVSIYLPKKSILVLDDRLDDLVERNEF